MQDFLENITSDFKNIWRYERFYPHKFLPSEKLYIDDLFTPIEDSKYLDGVNLCLKREDKNITGSLKSRGVAYQIAVAKQNKINRFVISTSGNAGITSSIFLNKYGGDIIVVTADSIPRKKIHALQKKCKYLLIAKNPMHVAGYISKKYNFFNLRPSRDENSIYGYYSIGFEIYEQLKNIPENIFIYSTSGSSFIGIYESFKILKEQNLIQSIPKMYAVNRNTVRTFRNNKTSEICHKTGGRIIQITREEFDSESFDTSFEGRSVLHAIRKIAPTGKTMAILTGSRYAEIPNIKDDIFRIEKLEDIDMYIKEKFPNSLEL